MQIHDLGRVLFADHFSECAVDSDFFKIVVIHCQSKTRAKIASEIFS